MKLLTRLDGILRGDDGSSLVELALVWSVIMLILMGAIDMGRAYFLAIEVAGAAHAGASYGIQSYTDTAGMKAAALQDGPDVSNLSITTPTYGCECSDGSSSSVSCGSKPTCSYNLVYWVKVKASATYSPLFPWPKVPSSITISQTAVMRSGS